MVAGCVFCEYNDPKAVVYDDERYFAIIDPEPINPHHVLVIPKEHYEDFIQLPQDLLAHLFQVVQRLSRAVRTVSKPLAIMHLTDDDVARMGYNLVAPPGSPASRAKINLPPGRAPGYYPPP